LAQEGTKPSVKKKKEIFQALHTMTAQVIKQHNPYLPVIKSIQQLDESPCPSPAPHPKYLPAGTLYECLAAEVNFVAYPETCPEPAYAQPHKDMLQRIFVGQLPYNVTTSQAEWVVTEATGCPTFHTEIIHRWTAGQEPKGCVHTYCHPQDVNRVQAMSKRILVDDTGIWVADDEAQTAALLSFCASLKKDKKHRIANRPYQPVVLEVAKSSFRPREDAPAVPAALACPPQYHAPHDFGLYGYASPPPSYTGFVQE
jgi:hypothetical protein